MGVVADLTHVIKHGNEFYSQKQFQRDRFWIVCLQCGVKLSQELNLLLVWQELVIEVVLCVSRLASDSLSKLNYHYYCY